VSAAWGVSFTKALYDEAGALLGVLDASLALGAGQAAMRGVQSNYGVRMATLELDESPRFIDSDAATPQPVPAAFSAFLDHAQPRFDGQFADIVSIEGTRQWVAAHLLESSIPWLVVVSRPVAWLDPQLGNMLYGVLVLGLVLFVGLTWVALHMARRFGQPLRARDRHRALACPPCCGGYVGACACTTRDLASIPRNPNAGLRTRSSSGHYRA